MIYRICSAVFFSIVLHAVIASGFLLCVKYNPSDGKIEKLAQLDLSAVELSFSKDEDSAESKDSADSTVCAMPPTPPCPPETETVPQPEISVFPKPETDFSDLREITVLRLPQDALPPPSPAMNRAKIEKDVVLRNPLTPKYPQMSRRKGEEGIVTLIAEVSERGTVNSVKVEKSSGFRRLDAAAVEAMKSAVFHPAESGGRQIGSTVSLDVRFSLEK